MSWLALAMAALSLALGMLLGSFVNGCSNQESTQWSRHMKGKKDEQKH